MSGIDAFQLRRGAADAVKFADGDFDRAGIVGRGRGGRPDEAERSGFKFCTVPLPWVEMSPTMSARP